MLIDIHKFDRYFFPLYPLLIFLLASSRDQRLPHIAQRMISLVSLAVMAAYSLIATTDYHAWQEARWNALVGLMEDQQVDPKQIDGGFEFNGWYETGPKNPSGKDSKSWWFVNEDEYAVARGSFYCYEIARKFPVNTWLNPIGDSLMIIKRPALLQRDTLFTDLEKLHADSGKAISGDSLYPFTIGGRLDTTVAFSGKHSVLLTADHPYGVSVELDDVQPCEQITVTAWRRGHQGSAGIVIRAPDVNVLHDFERYFVDDEQDGGWMHLRHELTVPSYYEQDILHVYLWNPVPDSIWVDDVRVIRRRTPLND